jgi:DNA-binding transcriptional LysR family regulator
MSMLDRLTGLEVFARVAGAGSLSAAARAMGMSQTMVTKHVAALESRLGVKLFHRTTRRLSITEAGRNYLESSGRILAEIEAADAAVAADRVEPRGLLRLNAPVSFGARQIAPLFAEFALRHPRVTVELGLNDRLVDLVEEGWDLAIRIGNLSNSSLIARRIAPCRTGGGDRGAGHHPPADLHRGRRYPRRQIGRPHSGPANRRTRRHLCCLPAGPSSARKGARVHRFRRGPLCPGAALGP